MESTDALADVHWRALHRLRYVDVQLDSIFNWGVSLAEAERWALEGRISQDAWEVFYHFWYTHPVRLHPVPGIALRGCGCGCCLRANNRPRWTPHTQGGLFPTFDLQIDVPIPISRR